MKEFEIDKNATKRKEHLPITSEELLGLQNNDEQVWNEIYERYNPYMVKVARGRVGEHKAEDMAQTVWLKFHSLVKKQTLVPDQLGHYLIRAVTNTSYTELSDEKRKSHDSIDAVFADSTMEMQIPDRAPNTEEKVVNEMQETKLMRDLGDMMGADRAQVLYLAAHDMEHNEIAVIQGVPSNTSQTRLHRGRNLALKSLDHLAKITDIPVEKLEERKEKAKSK